MATKFSLKDPNPGVWFKFDEKDPESGEIGVRVLNKLMRSELEKKCIKRRPEYKHGQRFEVTESDEDLFSELMWDYSIVGWEKLEDDDGNPLICNVETKVKLMRENVGFASFVNNCLIKLGELEENRVAVLEKNLSSGSSDLPGEKSQSAKPAKK